MKKNQLANYSDVLDSTNGVKHLLLGNGFSIACDPVFRYNNLFEFAKNHGLSPKVRKLFDYFGTTNFEQIARALNDVSFIGNLYKFVGEDEIEELQAGIAEIKGALISAIAQTHLAAPHRIDEQRRQTCTQFLKPYQNVFTTNYDLLLYWVTMQGNTAGQLEFQDGFRTSIDEPDADHVIFSDHLGRNKGLLYLHGALHLFEEQGEVRKHCWARSSVTLTQNVINSLDKNRYPLFVAEGESAKKLEHIQKSGYLSYCYQKLQRIGASLVVCGSTLGDSDDHILRAIANSDCETVWLGIYGGHESEAAKHMDVVAVRIEERRKRIKNAKALKIGFYDVSTVPIWSSLVDQSKKPSAVSIPRTIFKKA